MNGSETLTTHPVLNRGTPQVWEPPQEGWLRCDIGIEWCKRTMICGAAWILRDELGMVLLHSRCSFANITNVLEAHSTAWLWAIESMGSLRKSKVVFGVESADLLGAISRPPAWPSFKGTVKTIKSSLYFLERWKFSLANRRSNLPAYLIAKSAIVENFAQSYVSVGYPRWLPSFFV